MSFQIIFYSLLFIVLLALLFIYLKFIRPVKYVYEKIRAQGVSSEPFVYIFGQLPDVLRHRSVSSHLDYHQVLQKKHGNVFMYCIGPMLRVVVNEPDLLADILDRNNAQYYTKPAFASAALGPLVGYHSLLLLEGDEHERARRMINPAFHHVNLKSMISIITDQTAKNIQSTLDKDSSKNGTDQTVDLALFFNGLTLSIIVSSAFGADFETDQNAKKVMNEVLNEAADAILYRAFRMINRIPIISKLPFWKKDIADKGIQSVNDFVDQIIADRRQGRTSSLSTGADLLDLLLSAVDNDGQPFTDQQIKEQSLTFVLAGSDTTGNLMSWIFYVLTTHEDVLAACREEVDRVLPAGTEPTNEHLSEMVVCEAIISETLRLYPTAPLFVRYCVREHVVGSKRQLQLPAGAAITVDTFSLHRRKDLWPRADEFDYTRWMRDPKTGLKPKLPHPYAYLPFAAGTRNCIGQNFALLEAKIILAMFVQRCDFTLVPGQKIVPELKVTMRPKYGLLVKINKR